LATELVDAHCHFDFPVFDGHRDAILAQAGQLGISTVVVPGPARITGSDSGIWRKTTGLYAMHRASTPGGWAGLARTPSGNSRLS